MNKREPREEDPLERHERYRSNFVKELVQRPKELGHVPATLLAAPPKRIVQFWDDLARLPKDVRECMESWKKLEQSGFELQVFDENSAREFISMCSVAEPRTVPVATIPAIPPAIIPIAPRRVNFPSF